MKKEAVVGIDPGKNGAIALLDTDGYILEYIQFNDPTPEEIASIIVNFNDKYEFKLVGMELVHVLPGQGVVSSGKFMELKGTIKGILAACEITYIEITPQKWRKLSPILASSEEESKSDSKKKSLEYVKQRWPTLDINYKIADIDLCDALCIAEYLRTFFLKSKQHQDLKQIRLQEAREWMASVKGKQQEEREKRMLAKKAAKHKK